MRLLPILLAVPLLAFQAHAQTTPPVSPAPAEGVTAPSASAPVTTKHHRMTWKERFDQANVAHDGHLTLQEARGGDLAVARHFTDIDADKKGYVTEEDIDKWHKLQRATRHIHKKSAEKGRRSRHEVQQGMNEPQKFNTAASSMPPPVTQADAPAAGVRPTEK